MQLLINSLSELSKKNWSIELLNEHVDSVDFDNIDEESVISDIAYFDVEIGKDRISIKNSVTLKVKKSSAVRSALFEFGNMGALFLASAGEMGYDLIFASSYLIRDSTVVIDSFSISLPSF